MGVHCAVRHHNRTFGLCMHISPVVVRCECPPANWRPADAATRSAPRRAAASRWPASGRTAGSPADRHTATSYKCRRQTTLAKPADVVLLAAVSGGTDGHARKECTATTHSPDAFRGCALSCCQPWALAVQAARETCLKVQARALADQLVEVRVHGRLWVQQLQRRVRQPHRGNLLDVPTALMTGGTLP